MLPISAQAVEIEQDNGGMTIVTLGVQEERAFFNVAERPAQTRSGGGCLYELYYVKLDTPRRPCVIRNIAEYKKYGEKIAAL